ncbi:hypothetical protein RYX36_004320, partial [Vicia faba]
KSFSDKEQGKRPMVYSSPPPTPKKSRTTVLEVKATSDVRIKKKSSNAQTTKALCHKEKHLLLEDNLQLYQENFLNNPVDSEYYVNAYSETELRAKFLKPFAKEKLLKFIGLNNKYNHDYVEAFYYNLELTLSGIENKWDFVKRGIFDRGTEYFGLRWHIQNE